VHQVEKRFRILGLNQRSPLKIDSSEGGEALPWICLRFVRTSPSSTALEWKVAKVESCANLRLRMSREKCVHSDGSKNGSAVRDAYTWDNAQPSLRFGQEDLEPP
jgi:hypothetical protein